MARYILISAVVGRPERGTYNKYGRGRSVADTAENAQPGDLIWPALTNAPSPVNMRPLDEAASAIMNLPITTLAEVAVSSAGGAAGDAAGI